MLQRRWQWQRGPQYSWSPRAGGSLPWWFYALFIGSGLGMLIGGSLWLRSTQHFVSLALSAEGSLVRYEQRTDDDGTAYYPVVRFTTAAGREVEFTGGTGSSFRPYRAGRPLKVLYDPDDPQHASIASFMELWFFPLLLLGMGLLFCGIGVGVFVAVRRQQARALAAGLPPDAGLDAMLQAELGFTEPPLGSVDELKPAEDD